MVHADVKPPNILVRGLWGFVGGGAPLLQSCAWHQKLGRSCVWRVPFCACIRRGPQYSCLCTAAACLVPECSVGLQHDFCMDMQPPSPPDCCTALGCPPGRPPTAQVMLDARGLVTTAHLTDFGSVQFVAPGCDHAPAIWCAMAPRRAAGTSTARPQHCQRCEALSMLTFVLGLSRAVQRSFSTWNLNMSLHLCTFMCYYRFPSWYPL